ncbi:MAG TPA: DUF1673 family protein [Methanosarcina vacuolata]|nr:DUF1673 family protein [Methanosarcina vacuolata]HPS88430.1 DUF1673 family protein [Methanosarcina vacuolata]
MNVFTKSIRKIMGWCPNAKALETGSQNIPANFEVYDRSGEKPGNNLSRMKRIGLLLVSIGALISTLSNFLASSSNTSPLKVGAGWLLFFIGILLFAIGFVLYVKS